MIPVTRPFLPEKSEYQHFLDSIWQSQWLTNDGPLLNQFEEQIGEYLGTSRPAFVNNGCTALQLGIKALNLTGEIITTPFSYVATTSAIVWENCKPVFVDIDASTLNIDAAKIEAAISDDTSAILATHCFGNACDIEAIEEIAVKHNLHVIYDAAHCFGTKYKDKSIFEYGDISITSLHATKLMHSVEGGLVFSGNQTLHDSICYLRNCGHDGYEGYASIGINGKNSEFHAAMGLSVLEHIEVILEKRKQQCELYDELLQDASIRRPVIQQHCDYNFAYYPVVFESEEVCLSVKKELEKQQIYPRRYFYPSLNQLPYVEDRRNTPNSEKVALAILCLPLFHNLSEADQNIIAETVRKVTTLCIS